MKLATLKSADRDGTLLVVSRDLSRAVRAGAIAPNLQAALDQWATLAPVLRSLADSLDRGERRDAFLLDPGTLAAPLPRAYQWLDGSAYLSHVERARKARGAEMPPELRSDPLMYQGGSAPFLGPREPIVAAEESWGVDFEAEVAVITDEVPMAINASAAADHIKLIMLVNDISLRNLIAPEIAKGFGFLQSKPPTAASPAAVTPDELGSAWDGGKVYLPLYSYLNHQPFGRPNAGEDMQFAFPALIAHAARTRPLPAGTIIGSGTVSNYNISNGFSCIVEKRLQETLESGAPTSRFLRSGDRVCIEMLDAEGRSIFGAIEQRAEIAKGI